MNSFEDFLHLAPEDSYLLGTDEVGRGPIAGPVVAAASLTSLEDLFVVTHYLQALGVTDSKKLSHNRRKEILMELGLKPSLLLKDQKVTVVIQEMHTLTFVIKEISHLVIDELNILNASLLAMREAVTQLSNELPIKGSATLLVDGNKLVKKLPSHIREIPLVKGDQRSMLIAISSIIAKVYRDDLMKNYSLQYEGYGFEQHAGYPTPTHLRAIKEKGITEIHRKSYAPVRKVIEGG